MPAQRVSGWAPRSTSSSTPTSVAQVFPQPKVVSLSNGLRYSAIPLSSPFLNLCKSLPATSHLHIVGSSSHLGSSLIMQVSADARSDVRTVAPSPCHTTFIDLIDILLQGWLFKAAACLCQVSFHSFDHPLEKASSPGAPPSLTN